MKKLFSIFLALVILSHVFVNVGIGVYYHLNKAYITQKLCENKSNTKMHCNGRCYLSKQLKKAEEGEQKQTQNIQKEKEEIISSNAKVVAEQYFPSFSITDFTSYQTSVIVSDYRNELVKPPAV